MRIETEAREGELRHAGAADDHETRRPQSSHGWRVYPGGGLAAKQARSGAGHLPGLVHVVLHRDRHAGVGRGRPPGPSEPVLDFSRLQSACRDPVRESAATLSSRICDRFEAMLGQRPARGRAASEIFSKAAEGGEAHAGVPSGSRLVSA